MSKLPPEVNVAPGDSRALCPLCQKPIDHLHPAVVGDCEDASGVFWCNGTMVDLLRDCVDFA